MSSLIACCIAFCVRTNSASAETQEAAAQPNVMLVETDNADCAANDGKLILIQSTSAEQRYEVWLDRWFMDVQTADHTAHILSPAANSVALGCSMTRNHEKQHWTIARVQPLP